MIEIRPFTITDYEPALALWRSLEGVGLSAADSRENIEQFLLRNPGLNFVAGEGNKLVGTVLCGHDGRRAYLYHVAVAPSHRRQKIGCALVERCVNALRQYGIEKCHLFVFDNNEPAIAFWKRNGWITRTDIMLMSKKL